MITAIRSRARWCQCFVALAVCTALAQSDRTVLDGVYTTEQAARGQEAYRDYCRRCHEGAGQDGPDLTGADFVDRWRGDRLKALFTQIRTNMPGNRPGSLTERTYVDILAFLLAANDLPSGGRELTTDVIDSVAFAGRDGPKPLPSMATVRVVGCLTAGPNDTWILVDATEPVRSKSINDTTGDELRESAASPPGTQRFRLQNVADRAAAAKGHRVQAKGVLVRQYMNDHINVSSLESIAATCR